MKHTLVLDQGTTSSRAILFNEQFAAVEVAQQEFPQIFPQAGWVEHDPAQIWHSSQKVLKQVLEKNQAKTITGLGITNQRETTILWDRKTGKPIYNAIVWQDRRTAEKCNELKKRTDSKCIKKTGLLLDPYFSATKIAWILDHCKNARQMAQSGRLAFGTVDCFLIWQLTNGKEHVTDLTNASRTCLFDIHKQQWDEELLEFFQIPASLLPTVKENCADFGRSGKEFHNLPICAVAGDQQAAAIGQQCFYLGEAKSTYGTGCFILVNTGNKIIQSKHKLLSTIGYKINGKISYALEGSIFNAGTTIQWLRDELKIIKTAADTEAIAAKTLDNGGIYFIPAFTGLGAPYWQPHVRGALLGITRSCNREQIVRACLESVAYQTADLLDAMAMEENSPQLPALRIDGGMATNNWLAQFLADVNQISIERPQELESTALGVAFLVALQTKMITDFSNFKNRNLETFTPKISLEKSKQLMSGWHEAIDKIIGKD